MDNTERVRNFRKLTKIPHPAQQMLNPGATFNTERVQRLWVLYQQIDELITADEMQTYPVLDHLGDLINDLEMDE